MQCPEFLPDYSTPIWTLHEWLGEGVLRFVRSYYHRMESRIGMHANEFYELDIIADGEGWHYLNQEQYPIKKGDVFIVPPGMKHGFFSEGGMIVFHSLIACAFFEQYDRELYNLPGFAILCEIEPYLRGKSKEPMQLGLFEEDYREIVPSMDALAALEKRRYAGRDTLMNAQLLYLLGLLSSYMHRRQNGNAVTGEDEIAKIIVRCMEYIRVNASKKISIDELSAQANMARSTFMRHFQRICGCTPISFLTKCRITNARKLLCYSDLSVAVISQECGFYDSSHFMRMFLREESMTPLDFRTIQNNKKNYAHCTLCIRRD